MRVISVAQVAFPSLYASRATAPAPVKIMAQIFSFLNVQIFKDLNVNFYQ